MWLIAKQRRPIFVYLIQVLGIEIMFSKYLIKAKMERSAWLVEWIFD